MKGLITGRGLCLMYNDSAYDVYWTRVWKLSKQEIEYHQTHWWETGYQPVETILTWPGNGYTTNEQMYKIAPFYDNNNDGVYNPTNGDYPVIKGDERTIQKVWEEFDNLAYLTIWFLVTSM